MPGFSGRARAPLLAALVVAVAATKNPCAEENDVFVHVLGIRTSWRSAVFAKDGLSAEFQFAADNQGFFSLRKVLGDDQYHALFHVGKEAILIQDGTEPLSGVALKLGCWQHNVYVGLNPRHPSGLEKDTGPRPSADVPAGAQRSLGDKRHGVLMKPKSFVRTKDLFPGTSLTILVGPAKSLELKHWSQYGLSDYGDTLSSGLFLHTSVLFPLELATAPARPWLNNPRPAVSGNVNMATAVGGGLVLERYSDCNGFQLHQMTHDVVRVSTLRERGQLEVIFKHFLTTTVFPVACADAVVYFRRDETVLESNPVVRMRAICHDNRIELRITHQNEDDVSKTTTTDGKTFTTQIRTVGSILRSHFEVQAFESSPRQDAAFKILPFEMCNFNKAESPLGFWTVGLCPDGKGTGDAVCESDQDGSEDYTSHGPLGGDTSDYESDISDELEDEVDLLGNGPLVFTGSTPSRDRPHAESAPDAPHVSTDNSIMPDLDNIFNELDSVRQTGEISVPNEETAEAMSAWETALPQFWSFATPLSPRTKVPIPPTEVEWYVRNYLRKVVAAQVRAAGGADEEQDESPFVDDLSESGGDASSEGQASDEE